MTMWCYEDPSLQDLLSDPLTLAVMAADGVNPRTLERTLTAMAVRLQDRSVPMAASMTPTRLPDASSVLHACCC